MNSLRRRQNLQSILLLAAILLAVQTLIFWHTHHGRAAPDDSCQLCLHVQHHTPATNSVQAPVLAVFNPVAVSQPINTGTYHPIYQITIPSRAPPVPSLT